MADLDVDISKITFTTEELQDIKQRWLEYDSWQKLDPTAPQLTVLQWVEVNCSMTVLQKIAVKALKQAALAMMS